MAYRPPLPRNRKRDATRFLSSAAHRPSRDADGSVGENCLFVSRIGWRGVHNRPYRRLHSQIGSKSAPINFSGLINNLVGTGQDRRRDLKVERSRGIEIDD